MTIVIANRQRTRKVNLRRLKTMTGRILARLGIVQAELGITLVAAPEMAALNERFLHHAGPTDVITFDYTRAGGARHSVRADFNGAPLSRLSPSSSSPALHGEIFVCVDEAVSQARHFKTSWQSETLRYLIHGVLHLLGHDDSRPAARRKMKQQENLLLARLSGSGKSRSALE